MANFEAVQMVLHTIQNMEGLRKDSRRNAVGYKADVGGRLTVLQTAEIMKGDAAEYLKRLRWQKNIIDTPAKKTKLLNGLAVFGITEAEATSAYLEMKASADTTIAATLTTQAEIEARSDAILTEVTEHDTVW